MGAVRQRSGRQDTGSIGRRRTAVRTLVAFTAAAAVFAGCAAPADDPDDGTGDGAVAVEPLRLFGVDGNVADAGAYFHAVEFDASGLDELDVTMPRVHRLDPLADLAGETERLAGVFTVPGDVVAVGDGWRAGPDDLSAPAVEMDRSGFWTYVDPDDRSEVEYRCDYESADPAADPACELVMPEGLPDAEQLGVLADEWVGWLNPAGETLEPYVSDEYGSYFEVRLAVEGVETDVSYGMGFGPQQKAVYAYGAAVTAVPVDGYVTVSAADAVGRLTSWPALAFIPSDAPYPADYDPAAPVRLVSASPTLTLQADEDGVFWLLPAWAYTTSYGDVFVALALADEQVVFVDEDEWMAGPGLPPAAGGDGADPGAQINAALMAAIDEVSVEIGVPPDEVVVVEASATLWPDASLGCPAAGEVYAQVEVDGYRFVLEAAGQTFVYHGETGRGPFLCPQDTPQG